MADIVDNRRRVKLEKPVKLEMRNPSGEVREEIVDEVVFKEELTGKEMMLMDTKDQMGSIVAITAAMTGQPKRVFEKMSAVDFMRCVNVTKDFLLPLQTIGANS